MNYVRRAFAAAIIAFVALTVVLLRTACDEGSPPAQPPAARRGVRTEPPQPRAADVQADVRAVNTALYSGDVEKLLDLTHPPIIEAMGGRGRVRAGGAGGELLSLHPRPVPRDLLAPGLT